MKPMAINGRSVSTAWHDPSPTATMPARPEHQKRDRSNTDDNRSRHRDSCRFIDVVHQVLQFQLRGYSGIAGYPATRLLVVRGVDRRQRQNGQAFHLADVSPTGIPAIQVDIPTAVRKRFQSRLKNSVQASGGRSVRSAPAHERLQQSGPPFFCAIGFPGQVHRTVPSGEPQYRRLSGGLHCPVWATTT